MMFPFEETEEETQEENLYIPREYGIDFETGQLPERWSKDTMRFLCGRGWR